MVSRRGIKRPNSSQKKETIAIMKKIIREGEKNNTQNNNPLSDKTSNQPNLSAFAKNSLITT
ncbi:19005_t:CDS:1, partial [Gigaspora margarita]